MQIRFLFFASYRELVGAGETTLQLPEGTDVAAAVAELRMRGSGFARLPSHPTVAVNQEFVLEDRVLEDGDVVALIPPVAGG